VSSIGCSCLKNGNIVGFNELFLSLNRTKDKSVQVQFAMSGWYIFKFVILIYSTELKRSTLSDLFRSVLCDLRFKTYMPVVLSMAQTLRSYVPLLALALAHLALEQQSYVSGHVSSSLF
jgi:hypothetical protein